MTTPTPSVATRIAAAILCALCASSALADRGVTAPGTLVAAENAPRAQIDAAPLRPFTIAGEIVDEHANPTPGITVTILAHGGEAVTDDLGRYLIDTRIPLDADSISIVASIPDERSGQRLTTHTASIEHDDPFLDAGVLQMRSGECEPEWVQEIGVPGMNNTVFALTVFDDGSGDGPALYAGGAFVLADGSPGDRIARWDGSSWSPLGSGMNGGSVLALTVFDDGSGPALYAGGEFTQAGGSTVNHIARWDGSSWSPLGSGVSGGSPTTEVHALTVFDDGSGGGPALYAGGSFLQAGGVPANRIARWDGSSWFPLGSGMIGGSVRALTVFDDGSGGGPALYAGGDYSTAGGVTVNRITRWDGSSWSPLGSGTNGGSVLALTVFDDGSGPALYAGGTFTEVGGSTARRIARWDGSSWSPLGSGVSGGSAPWVYALTVFDDGSGSGPALYAGGGFTQVAGADGFFAAPRIARWDGTQWSVLGSGMSASVRVLTVFDDGGGIALCAGGAFTQAGGVTANRIAKWRCPTSTLAIVSEPSSVLLPPSGGLATLSILAEGDDLTYQWYRDGVALSNSGNISGVNSPQLIVFSQGPSMTGLYSCLVTDTNSVSVMSQNAVLATRPSCPGDINFDGFVDLDDFIILAGNFGNDCN